MLPHHSFLYAYKLVQNELVLFQFCNLGIGISFCFIPCLMRFIVLSQGKQGEREKNGCAVPIFLPPSKVLSNESHQQGFFQSVYGSFFAIRANIVSCVWLYSKSRYRIAIRAISRVTVKFFGVLFQAQHCFSPIGLTFLSVRYLQCLKKYQGKVQDKNSFGHSPSQSFFASVRSTFRPSQS